MSVRVCVCTSEVKHLGQGRVRQGKAFLCERRRRRGKSFIVANHCCYRYGRRRMWQIPFFSSFSFFLRTLLRHLTPTYLLFVISSLN